MQHPLFSIVTVCYNSSATIGRTIKSVLAQECKDYEYVIVDGASKDETVNLIKCYEPQFEGRMRWVSEPDKGIYDAFSKGCKMAQGKYVWIVNSDDYIEPDALVNLKDLIATFDADNLPVISGWANFVSEDGKTVKSIMKCSKAGLERAYKKDSIGVVHPATLVPKCVYEKTGYFDERYKIIGDIDWFQRAYKLGIPFYFFEKPITNMADGGISNVVGIKPRIRDRKILLQKKYTNPMRRYYQLTGWIYRWYKAKFAKLIHYHR